MGIGQRLAGNLSDAWLDEVVRSWRGPPPAIWIEIVFLHQSLQSGNALFRYGPLADTGGPFLFPLRGKGLGTVPRFHTPPSSGRGSPPSAPFLPPKPL